jgi:aminoglycoside phosphotransferase (APT) family kinase protein
MGALPGEARAEQVTAVLAAAGFRFDPGAMQLDPREDRLAVRLPREQIAWFPLNERGRAALANERRVLRLLQMHCQFSVPRVVYENDDGWDLRDLVPGVVDPFGVLARVQGDSDFAYALGQDLGRALAEQHTRVPATDLAGWLPAAPGWPRAEDIPRLPEVVDDAELLARIDAAFRRRESTARVSDPVLVHGDLGPHNYALDPASQRLAGLFDYRDAVFGDRHHDFTYMIFQTADEPMLDGAIATYEPATGIAIDRGRVRLLNALAAIGFLAFRHGHSPDEHWCGRTLTEDLAWTNAALRLIGL